MSDAYGVAGRVAAAGRRRPGNPQVSPRDYAHRVPGSSPVLDPARLLDDLNEAQREAVLAIERAGRHPRRRRHRQDPGHQPPDRVRHRDRASSRGPGARRDLHRQGRRRDGRAAAGARAPRRDRPDLPRPRAQPAPPLLAVRHEGDPLPDLLDSKLPILVPLVRALPGHYRFTPAKDLASEIEWAKSRRLTPADLRGRH